ncbi:hypothetical protein MP228_002510 [Amoeboaphelidium protococcarum]|nr:hypothetical protein MP228_002510 [Amoeboaphelidium protococcarum]
MQVEESNNQQQKATSSSKSIQQQQKTPSKLKLNEQNLIPVEYLRNVIAPIYQGDCSNKTLKNLLIIIENLSFLPNVKSIILTQLLNAMDAQSVLVCKDLVMLEDTLSNALSKRGSDSLDQDSFELMVQQSILPAFTPNSSNQSKFLRLLKTVDYIYSRKKGSQQAKSDDKQKSFAAILAGARGGQSGASPTPSVDELDDGADAAAAVNDATQELISAKFQENGYKDIWTHLQSSLAVIQSNQGLGFVTSALLPLIECLMVMLKYSLPAKYRSKSIDQPVTLSRPQSASNGAISPQKVSESEELFFQFTEKNRKVLNQLVRQNPKLLRGSFSLLVHNPKILDFDSKRNYFNQQLHKKGGQKAKAIHVNVRRQYIFQDSYYQLQSKSGAELRHAKLTVRFHDEEGADYGGVTREWYQELTKEMFNPNYALFTPSAEKMGVTYQPNPASWVNPSHLQYFKFVGRIIGKAIYDGRLLDCYFTRSVYKHILNKNVDVSDMEAVDPEYHKSLVWILNNPIKDVLDLTFSTEHEEFGQTKIVDLIPNGRDEVVTDANKMEYVKLVVEYRLTKMIQDQIKSFLEGFQEIIPKELIAFFSEKELELLISGIPDIDIDDWKNNTEYRGGYTASSPQVQWFWRVVRSFDQEERAKLLQFATGTSKVPLEGFANLQGIGGKQKFQIHKDFGKTDRLPTAHTCFNQVDIPAYDTYEQLKERLYTSITEGNVGFGFE